ncbi:MAM and LDL-receptor class A domain-containing protein 1-like [Branchiostoma floridae]|uniref:MAM and LDL-receptor class A domain-containing protein 1-like n=1 Tax=Branchiostoma floridae TaxID=7739 RepID=A0A9J7KLP4_BRAFL|nr:MAM and LDL-receptor class A domain-containing protein 1-like [Branchiostoma floridae]
MCWTVFLRNVNCVMLGLVFAHLWTLSMQQGDCDFDTTLCGYQQDNTDDFDWTRQQGSTATTNTGPSFDHTTGSGYYMYIETSRQERDDVARLISPTLPNNIRCLEFWYHMYGDHTEELKVYTKPTGSSLPGDPIWSKTGDKGDVWQRARVHLEVSSDFKVVFEGVRGTSYRGDIAIDDVSFGTTPCGGDCDFDENLCGYQQDNTDDFDWTRDQGSTTSSGTGPSSDHTTGSTIGSYMYIETSGQQPRDVARLISPVLSTDSKCLEFWYHMYGESTEELRVYQSSTGSSQLGTPIWSLTGDQGDVWYNATVDLAAGSNLYLVFEGVRGSSFQGDIAIDDISVRTTSCGGSIGTTTATAAVTPTTVAESTTHPATAAAETTASLQVTTPAPTTQRATTEGVTTLGGTTTEAVPSER